ncbi:uncharacterized protein LOC109821461 [Asparagus officinalis]|uniref:uncharacterized protein LOC109821461 n=1 Tax=Asparagus officinalis TaxID=4686 RepID=UPI00098E06B3|nr:uncharacterized protein LOC109821461 [Asparagus officinalis]
MDCPLRLIQGGVPQMITRGRGKIVNVGSVSAPPTQRYFEELQYYLRNMDMHKLIKSMVKKPIRKLKKIHILLLFTSLPTIYFMHIISKILYKLEIRTFDISVVSVVLGASRSNLGNTSLERYNTLPEWKFYKLFEAAI